MLLIEKNIGYVKGRAMFNGKQSRVWMNKEEKASPTGMNDITMIYAAIYYKEGRYLMGADLPNTFI